MSLFDKIAARFNVSETKLKVFRNLYWAVVGKVITLLGSLLVGIMVARYLGPEQYGLMNYVISYVALFQVLASFGLDNIEIREESKASDKRDIIIGTAFTLKCIFALVAMAVVMITALLFEADGFTKAMICMYSLSMLLNSFGVIRNHFTSLVWNEYVVKTEISRTIIGAIIKVVLLLLHAPLFWFIAATLFDVLLVASGYCVAYTKKIDKISLWRFDKEWAIYLIKQSFPLLLSGAAVIIYQRIDQVMIGNMIDKASVGQFSVASKFVEILIFIPTIMSQTITPILVRIREKSQEEYERKAQLFMNVTVWVCLLMAIFVSVFSFWLIRYTFGSDYLLAVPVLQIMAFKIVGMALSNTAGQMIIIEKMQKYAFIRNLLGCIVCVLLNLWLIPIYGIVGSAIVTIITTMFVGCFANVLIRPYHRYLILQLRTLFFGWKDLLHVRKLFL